MKQYNVKFTDNANIDWSIVDKANIDQFTWGGAERAPKAYGQMAYAKTGGEDEGVYIHLVCYEKNPVAIETEHNGRVWEDSCLECFFSMQAPDKPYKGYMNVECNCNGVSLIAFGPDSETRYFVVDLGIKPFDIKLNKTEDMWELFEFVPLAALKELFGVDEVNESTMIRGNFFKCDENANAPFGMWSAVIRPEPDFHVPEFFGEFKLVK